MKRLFLIALVGCAGHPVILWGSTAPGEDIRIQIDSDGHGNYRTTTEGVTEINENLKFTKGQLGEIHDMFRNHNTCSLVHDETYSPVANEGQVTVQLSFDDLKCTVTMYDLEWQRAATREIAETMRSMRPLHGAKRANRKLDPRGANSPEH